MSDNEGTVVALIDLVVGVLVLVLGVASLLGELHT